MDSGFPRTVIEFEERFATEASCIAYLREHRWPKGFECPKCGGTKSWAVRGGRQDECAKCGRQTSITAGTTFHGTRKPLKVWFRAMAAILVSKQGCSAKELERLFGLAHETAWTWGHKLRALMEPSSNKLLGRVEIDESYFGGEDDAAHKGRSISGKKVCVVAAVEDKGKAMGRARLEVVSNAKATSLGAYEPLASKGYQHEREVVGNPKTAAKKFPHVHRLFSLARRVLLATHQGSVSDKHLQYYLDEYVFRFNRRSSSNRFTLVERLLERVFVRAPTYAKIVGAGLGP